MKKPLLLTLLLTFGLSYTSAQTTSKQENLLWYNHASANWNEALPIGNGHLGAMVFGNVQDELIRLNDNTLYSGEPATVWKVHDITPSYDKVVALLEAGHYDEAYNLIQYHWLGRLHENYQPLGDIHVHNYSEGEVSDYYRHLDIANSTMLVRYTQNGVQYTRELFASYPDDVVVIRFKANRKDALDMRFWLTSPHKPTTSFQAEGNLLKMSGQAPGHAQRRSDGMITGWKAQGRHPELYFADGTRKYKEDVLYGDQINGLGTFFETRVRLLAPGAKIENDQQGIRVSGTDEITLILASATSFVDYKTSPSRQGKDAAGIADATLSKAQAKTFAQLLDAHVKDYQALFSRVGFRLSADPAKEALPTDDRVCAFESNYDQGLVAKLFHYGRYLMISASRPGGQPMNLQGMWNEKVIPSWNCGYTLNINAEMNYWPAETANLSECAEPFFRMIGEMAESGSVTARNMYGRSGWVAHHNTSIWRETHPNDGTPTSSFWPMASAWLSSHLWEHYLYTGDLAFLREAYPIIKGAAEFFTEWLVDNGEGYLVTPVSNSPENSFYVPNDTLFFSPGGLPRKPAKSAISMGSTMDMSLIRELFANTVEAAALLGVDEAFCQQLRDQSARLLPFQIGGRGQLQEWEFDFREAEPHHRHVSHLYGLHPGNQITYDENPELFQAVMKTLRLRGDEATGWSMGWKINLWARLLDGDHANIIVSNLFNPIGFGHGRGGGGLYPNLLDAHAPFQIDGNFGYTSGIIEMLMQSHAGFIQLLPALPSVWKEGRISGIRTRGGFVIDLEWANGRFKKAVIESTLGGNCRLRTDVPVKVKGAKAKPASGTNPNPLFKKVQAGAHLNHSQVALEELPKKETYTIDFPTVKGKKYTVTL